MKITITMDLTTENLNKLRLLLSDEQIPEQLPLLNSHTTDKAEPPTGTAIDTFATPAPEAPVKNEEQKITETDVRAVAMKLSKAGKQAELAAIFAKFGCKKLSDFKKCPENYPALMEELVKANA